MNRESGALAFKLEDDHAGVVPGGEDVQAGVGGDDPKAVVLAPEGVETSTLGHIPYADRLVLGVGHD